MRYLARGPTTAADATRHLQISQPVFSRLVARSRDDLLVVGRARATRYAAYRDASGTNLEFGGFILYAEFDRRDAFSGGAAAQWPLRFHNPRLGARTNGCSC